MWDSMSSHWDDWGHPLRPNAEDVRTYWRLLLPVRNPGCKILLLGNTQEIKLLTTDFADERINGFNWFNLPYKRDYFDAILGDGVITQTGMKLVPEVMKYLKPGCSFISRVFIYNDSPVLSYNFNFSKFQNLGTTEIPVQEIYNLKGDHPTTRAYNGSKEIYYFPKLEDLQPFDYIWHPAYEHGRYFPFVMWTRK